MGKVSRKVRQSLPESPQPRMVSAEWNGPLPPPAALEAFDRIAPGSAERILSMAEREQAHRLERETEYQRAAIADGRRGQSIGAVIAIAALVLAAVLVLRGAAWQVPALLIGVPLLGIVRAFIRGRSSQG